jgi:uncharacterized protein YbcI
MQEANPQGARADGADASFSVKSEISREMVRMYKDQFGRGPTKARTEFAGPDVVVCVLEHSFTPAERRMVEMGEHQRLRDVRMFFQHASEKEFCEVIERLLGRRVRAFVSGVDTNVDVSTEVFHLEPEAAEPASPQGSSGSR